MSWIIKPDFLNVDKCYYNIGDQSFKLKKLDISQRFWSCLCGGSIHIKWPDLNLVTSKNEFGTSPLKCKQGNIFKLRLKMALRILYEKTCITEIVSVILYNELTFIISSSTVKNKLNTFTWKTTHCTLFYSHF